MTDKAPQQTLDFAALVPTHHTFKDVDGKDYPFRSRYDFGAVDYARLQGLQNKAQAAVDRLKVHEYSDERAAQEIEDSFRGLTHMLIPTLPPDRISEFSVMQMEAIWSWWQRLEAPEEPEGETGTDNGADQGEATPG